MLATSGVPHGFVLGPILFIIYINDVDVGLSNLVSKDANYTKVDNSVLIEVDRLSLQKDLHTISAWSERWEMPFNTEECQVLQTGTKNKKYYYEMCAVNLRNVQCAKEPGIKIASSLKFSQQSNDAANKANRILGFIKRNFSFKNKDVILPLYSTLVRPHLQYAVQF